MTRQVGADYVSWVARAASPEAAGRVRDALAHMDLAAEWERRIASDGLRPGDVSDALAGYWILNWLIATGSDSGPTRAAGARAQARRTLSNTASFARLRTPEKQAMAETLMVNFIPQRDPYVRALQTYDEAYLQKARAAATARFRNELGLDPHLLVLGPEGLVRRA